MLNLIKHELKAIASEFYGIMIGLFALAVFGPVLLRSNSPGIIAITFLAVFAVLIALSVISFLVMLKVLNKRLYGEIGYLQHTLPVSSTKLLASKIVTIIIIQVMMIVAFVLAFLIFMSMVVLLNKGGASIFEFFSSMIFKSDLIMVFLKYALLLLPYAFVTGLFSANVLLFVITTINTSFVRKHKLIIGIILFIVLTAIFNYLEGYLFAGELISFELVDILVPTNDPVELGNMFAQSFSNIDMKRLLLMMGYQLMWAGLIFSANQYLVDHKLEI
jgi:hypothetical protein